jgi:hypothetical protein
MIILRAHFVLYYTPYCEGQSTNRKERLVCDSKKETATVILLQARSQHHNLKNSAWYLLIFRDSVVSTATRYGLDGPGTNPDEGEFLRARPDGPRGPLP